MLGLPPDCIRWPGRATDKGHIADHLPRRLERVHEVLSCFTEKRIRPSETYCRDVYFGGAASYFMGVSETTLWVSHTEVGTYTGRR